MGRIHQTHCPRLQAWDDSNAPCLCRRIQYECKAMTGLHSYCGKRANSSGYCRAHRQLKTAHEEPRHD